VRGVALFGAERLPGALHTAIDRCTRSARPSFDGGPRSMGTALNCAHGVFRAAFDGSPGAMGSPVHGVPRAFNGRRRRSRLLHPRQRRERTSKRQEQKGT